MTCIAAIEQNGKVWLGGDSAGVSYYDIRNRKDSKVFILEKRMILGFTTSFRMGQLLRYSLKLPPQTTLDNYCYLCTDFVNAVRECLKRGGFARVKDCVEQGGTFLLGYRGKLYRVEEDFQVGQVVDSYDACGCGENYALGSLYTTAVSRMFPHERIKIALNAAATFSSGVAPPFRILSL